MSQIELDVAQGVATIYLNAPERRNALTTDMVSELLAVCDRIDADRAVARSFRLEVGPPQMPPSVGREAERAAQMWSLRRQA